MFYCLGVSQNKGLILNFVKYKLGCSKQGNEKITYSKNKNI